MRLSNAERTARWRQSKDTRMKALLDEVNAMRAQLNLPKFSLEIPRRAMKGEKKIQYYPPTEMTAEELRQWRSEKRKIRKAEDQRLNRKKKAALLKSLREQLTILDDAIKNNKKGEDIDPKMIDVATIIKECVDSDQKRTDTHCASTKTAETNHPMSAGDFKNKVQEKEMPIIDPLNELEEIHAARGLNAKSCIRDDESIIDIPIPDDVDAAMLTIDGINEGLFDDASTCF